ncbi:hypothetical protein H0H92_008634 [Tricholoma furcatifolium]|nr:hypothetical protein H0H92_008634 [Tricholoma furcatifolium]
MLTTNQRLDQLAAARIDFQARGVLNGSLFQDTPPIPPPPDNDDDDGGAVDDGLMGEVVLARKPLTKLPQNVYDLAAHLDIPTLPDLISRFLYQQAHPDHDPLFPVPRAGCPRPVGTIHVFSSAVATFFAPSDKSGVNGMYRERIRSVSSWRKGPERRDCVFVSHDEALPGFRGLIAARVLLFFSITHERRKYSCALVTWFSPVGEDPCPETGLWVVVPDLDANGDRIKEVINLDAIVRGAHLIGRAGDSLVPHQLRYVDSLDVFREFYVNKYIDHHSHEIAF